jgi:Tol biopolymer transport system component
MKLAHYEILSALGKGGMGEVWRARDSKLGREVAIKTLPAEFAGDSERLTRFEREARVLAALNHPNIASIYGLEEHAEGRFIVLELVEGETLQERIQRGPMPAEDAIKVALQIATAVEAAHEKGVVHRDLKPANIKITTDGQVKVLDFGLAKALEIDSRNSPLSNSPTMSLAGTAGGHILGTAAYMSPEQARAAAVDHRADVWAFGCVLYEMLTGRQAFRGETFSDILASVLARDPDFTLLGAPLHPRIRELIQRCLEKDPKRRWQAIGDVRVELDRIASSGEFRAEAVQAIAAKPRLRSLLLWVAAAALVASAVTWMLKPVPATESFPMRAVIVADGEGPLGPATLSPDGHSIAYSGLSRSGQGRVLYLRRLDQSKFTEIAGTNGARYDGVFSPDGKSIAFIANRRKIVKVPLDGGAAVTLGDVADEGGIDWSSSGDIVLGSGTDELLQGLFRVNETGGPVKPFTQVDKSRKELSHQLPRVLADGKTVLFTMWFGTARQAQLAAASLDDGKVVPLGLSGIKALGVVDGQLVYVTAEGVAMAVPFDLKSLRTSGAPTPVQDSIRVAGSSSNSGDAFLTKEGGLVFLSGNESRRVVWVDRSGRASPALEAAREYSAVRLSPNERQVAATILTGAKTDLWTIDLSAATLTPLTTTGVTRNASWSADGRRILYASNHGGSASLWWHPADGSGAAVMAAAPPHNPWNVDLSPDGHTVLFAALYNGTLNLESFSLNAAPNSVNTVRQFADSAVAAENHGRFSPDGHWVAYQSDESGRNEVYVRPASATGGRVTISANGGARPVWGRDGKHLFYLEGNRMVEATLAFEPAPRVVSRDALFEGRYEPTFDVSKDGRFLMIESAASGLSLIVVPNWRTELRRLTTGPAR